MPPADRHAAHLSDFTMTFQQGAQKEGSHPQRLTRNCNYSLLGLKVVSANGRSVSHTDFSKETKAWLSESHNHRSYPCDTQNKKQPAGDRERCSHLLPWGGGGSTDLHFFGLPQSSRPVQADLLTYFWTRESLTKQKISVLPRSTHHQSIFSERQARSENPCRRASLAAPAAGVILGTDVTLKRIRMDGTSADTPSWSGPHHSLSHKGCSGALRWLGRELFIQYLAATYVHPVETLANHLRT